MDRVLCNGYRTNEANVVATGGDMIRSDKEVPDSVLETLKEILSRVLAPRHIVTARAKGGDREMTSTSNRGTLGIMSVASAVPQSEQTSGNRRQALPAAMRARRETSGSPVLQGSETPRARGTSESWSTGILRWLWQKGLSAFGARTGLADGLRADAGRLPAGTSSTQFEQPPFFHWVLSQFSNTVQWTRLPAVTTWQDSGPCRGTAAAAERPLRCVRKRVGGSRRWRGRAVAMPGGTWLRGMMSVAAFAAVFCWSGTADAYISTEPCDPDYETKLERIFEALEDYVPPVLVGAMEFDEMFIDWARARGLDIDNFDSYIRVKEQYREQFWLETFGPEDPRSEPYFQSYWGEGGEGYGIWDTFRSVLDDKGFEEALRVDYYFCKAVRGDSDGRSALISWAEGNLKAAYHLASILVDEGLDHILEQGSWNSFEGAQDRFHQIIASTTAGRYPGEGWRYEYPEESYQMELNSRFEFVRINFLKAYYHFRGRDIWWAKRSTSYEGVYRDYSREALDHAYGYGLRRDLDSKLISIMSSSCSGLQMKPHFNAQYYRWVTNACQTMGEAASELKNLHLRLTGILYGNLAGDGTVQDWKDCKNDIQNCKEYQEVFNEMNDIFHTAYESYNVDRPRW